MGKNSGDKFFLLQLKIDTMSLLQIYKLKPNQAF